MCWSPITLKREKMSFVAGHLVNRHLTVPCGKCLECLQRQRADWSIRLAYEEKICKSSAFVTLTYDDFSIPVTDNGNNTLSKYDLQCYCKRIYNKGLRFFAVGEYGSHTFRPHYHLAVFNADPEKLVDKWSLYGNKKGNVKLGEINPASIHYLTKYLVNPENKMNFRDSQKPFRLMSKGLGNGYQDEIRDYCISNKSNVVILAGGNKGVLPRYIADKVFSKAEKFEIAEKAIQDQAKKRNECFEKIVDRHWYKLMLSEKTSKSNKC